MINKMTSLAINGFCWGIFFVVSLIILTHSKANFLVAMLQFCRVIFGAHILEICCSGITSYKYLISYGISQTNVEKFYTWK